jgi:cellulose synthase operon protein C
MQTLNVRLAAICLVSIILVGGGTHLLHSFQVRHQAYALRDKAYALKDSAARDGESDPLNKAIRLLENYVALKPTNREAQLDLGLLYDEKRQAGSAFFRLEEGLRNSDRSTPPEDEDFQKSHAKMPREVVLKEWRDLVDKARRKLVDAALEIGRLPDAEVHLAQLMQETPDDPKLLDLHGRILFTKGDYKTAEAQFRKAIAKDPKQLISYLHLADLLRTVLDRKTEADQVMRDMVYGKDKQGEEINGKSREAHEYYARYLRDRGNADEVLVETDRLLKLAPESPVALWLTGCCYQSKGQYEKAEGYVKRAIAADKRPDKGSDNAERNITDTVNMHITLADIKTCQGFRDESMNALKQGLEATKGTSGYAELLYHLVSQCIDNNRLDEAAKLLRELSETRMPPKDTPFPAPLVGYLEARLALMKGDWKSAKATLLEILPKLTYAPAQKMAYVYLAGCYRQDGDLEQAMVAYSQAAKIDNFLFPARAGLAEILLSRGNFAEAAEQYRILTGAPRPETDAFLALARTSIVIRLHEEKAKRDWEPVDKLLDQIATQIQKQPAAEKQIGPQVAAFQAEVLLAKDQPGEANRLLTEASKKYPKSAQIWLALINLSMHQAESASDPVEKDKLWNQAAKDTEAAEAALGDRAVVREIKASLAGRRKDPQLDSVMRSLGENVDKMSVPEKTQLWASLGAQCRHDGNLDLAQHYYRLIARQDAKNIPIRHLLCELNLQLYEKDRTPDLAELDKLVNDIEQLSGRGPFWLYGKAVRTLVQSKTPDPKSLLEARGYLKEAMEIRKEWSAPVVLAGKICQIQGEPDQALDYYLQAIWRLGERDNDVMRRAVHLLVGHGRVDEANQLFAYLENQKSPLLGEMQQDHVLVRVFRGNISDAVKDVESCVAADSKKSDDFLRQGELYGILVQRLRLKAMSERRDPRVDPELVAVAQRAVNSFLKARLLNPQSGRVWIELVQLLVDIGQPDKVKPLMEKAERTLTGDEGLITLGICYEKLNELEKAQAKFEEAAKAAPQNSVVLRDVSDFYLRNKKFEEAEPLLARIVALQSPATLTVACWARRQQAMLLKNRGDFDHFCQGLALIDENLRSNAASMEDKAMRVRFLITDPRKEKLGEAAAAMEELVKGQNATIDDNFILAQLYLRRNAWNRYVQLMRDGVLASKKGSPKTEYLVFYIDSLLQKNVLEDADNWLQTLEKSSPDLFDTVRLRAEYKFLRGEHKAASDLVMDFLNNPRAQPQARWQQLLFVAQEIEKFADQLKKAEQEPKLAAALAEDADRLFSALRSKEVCPAGDLYYATYLARQKRVREFLDILDQCWDKFPADSLLIPVAQVLDSQAVSQAQGQQLEKILVAASKKANGSVPILMLLGKLHMQQQQNDKAIADYRDLLAHAPRHFQAMNNLAVGLARSGQHLDEALQLVNNALAIGGPRADVLDTRVLVRIARNEPELALNDAAAAVKDEGTGEQYFHQAWAYSLAGKKTEASSAFREATIRRLDPKDLDPHEVSVYYRLKDGL